MLNVMLQQSRKNKGLTQKELAKRIGVSFRTIQNWESKKDYPYLSKELLIIARYLELTLDDLISSLDEPISN